MVHQNIDISQTSSGFIPLDHEYLKKVSETYETTYIGAIGTIVNTIIYVRIGNILFCISSGQKLSSIRIVVKTFTKWGFLFAHLA